MTVVANQAVAFDRSILTACCHLLHLGVSSAHLRACHEQPVNWVTGHGALGLHGAIAGLPTMHSELRRLQGPCKMGAWRKLDSLAPLAWESAKRDCVSLGPCSKCLPGRRVAERMS